MRNRTRHHENTSYRPREFRCLCPARFAVLRLQIQSVARSQQRVCSLHMATIRSKEPHIHNRGHKEVRNEEPPIDEEKALESAPCSCQRSSYCKSLIFSLKGRHEGQRELATPAKKRKEAFREKRREMRGLFLNLRRFSLWCPLIANGG